MSFLLLLPADIILSILELIPINSKLALFCTCKQLNSLVVDKDVIKRKIFEDHYKISAISRNDEILCRIAIAKYRFENNIHRIISLSYWEHMKLLFDEKTNWITERIKLLQSLPDTSAIISILQILKKNNPHLPPPDSANGEHQSATITFMEQEYIKTPTSAHKIALQDIVAGIIPYYQMISWASYWYEYARAFFKFEIIVVSPTKITGHYACGWQNTPRFELVFEASSLEELQGFLSACETDFIFQMSYNSSFMTRAFGWGNYYYNISKERIQFEYEMIQQFNNRNHNAIDRLIFPEQAKQFIERFDNLYLPHHNSPKPPNPIPVQHPMAKIEDIQNYQLEVKSTAWRPVEKKKRTSSKTLNVAFQRCVRRCIYFLFQVQLEKYWPPPPGEFFFTKPRLTVYNDDKYTLKLLKHLEAYWVPFSETSAHNTMPQLWPIFLLEAAIWIVKPVATIVTNYVHRVNEKEYKEAVSELRNQSFYVDQNQLEILLCILNKE